MSLSRRVFARTLTAAGMGVAFTPSAGAQNGSLFRHGVASGDPLTDRVILWTRLTPPADEEFIPVEWIIAEDPSLNRVVQRGLTSTNAAYDYTVKVDAARLRPGTTYYYRFLVRGLPSPIGRTRTLPAGTVDRLRMAVVSCSNYPYGYFNAYRAIADRNDLDVVLHLGDYIYEYANAEFGDGSALNRTSVPNKEIVTLTDYRQRHAQYRSDPDLQEVHRQHPFVAVWDDHEVTNDSWRDGAQNHQPELEGDWAARKAVGLQAWYEWMPVRENNVEGGQIYRTFRFGNLVDLIMLDTRLVGRDQQVPPDNPAIAAPARTLLGPDQEAWLYRRLSGSQARSTRWRVLGQQVMMAQLLGANGVPFNSDQWDGYIASRNRLLQYIGDNSINNVVVLTGDIHTSWGNEIAVNPFAAATATRQAVEFVTPAVTSPGIDNLAQATALEGQIGATHPHVKYVNLFRRGYLLVDVTRERAQAEWYHMRTITSRTPDQELARVLQAPSGESRLVVTAEASRPATNGAPFAP